MIYSYRRVSTDEQHNGPQAQADAIQRWVGAQQSTEHMDFFDNGVSGSVPLAERPQARSMMDHFVQFEHNVVVVAKLDRLFRSVADAATTIEGWNKRGIQLIALAEGFDMGNPYGRAMAQMASVFAELERAMIRERTKAALAAKKARCECVGQVPYGWHRVSNAAGNKTLAVVYSEQDVIRQFQKLRLEGKSVSYIADIFNNLSIPAKNGGKWHATQVRRILKRGKA